MTDCYFLSLTQPIMTSSKYDKVSVHPNMISTQVSELSGNKPSAILRPWYNTGHAERHKSPSSDFVVFTLGSDVV